MVEKTILDILINSYITSDVLIHCSIPGIAGGFSSFLYALKKAHYRNNRYLAKVSIEIGGALCTATIIAASFPNNNYRLLIAFAIGLAWADIIQIIRKKITKMVETILGEAVEAARKEDK